MDYDNYGRGEKPPVSVIQGEGFYFNSRIFSRECSVGQSSRIYYRATKANQGVPFKWEMQPGTPKNPPREETIPPPTPPPAVQSLGLRRPCLGDHQPKDSRGTWRFWKKNKKRQQSKTIIVDRTSSNKYGSSDFGDSDRESQCSSTSSPSSSSNNPNFQQSRLERDDHKKRMDVDVFPFSCSPWNISGILVSVVKRF